MTIDSINLKGLFNLYLNLGFTNHNKAIKLSRLITTPILKESGPCPICWPGRLKKTEKGKELKIESNPTLEFGYVPLIHLT